MKCRTRFFAQCLLVGFIAVLTLIQYHFHTQAAPRLPLVNDKERMLEFISTRKKTAFPQLEGRDRLTTLSQKTNISEAHVQEILNATLPNGINLEHLSSVNHRTCCGLGHRLARLAGAAWVAKHNNMALRAFWGVCGNDTEVFQYLFGVQPRDELVNVTSTHQHIQLNNDIPGFRFLHRNPGECRCSTEQEQVYYDFYSRLRERFRLRDEVNAFVAKHFANKFVIGIHIRAGNGETGDFVNKNRGIRNESEWAKLTSEQIVGIFKIQNTNLRPLLFIATDTPSMIGRFRSELAGIMPVIDVPQQRPEEGAGVFFGEKDPNLRAQMYKCLGGWSSAMLDNALLSHVDLLFAPLHSTFIYSLPMSLVLGKKRHRKAERPFCDLPNLGSRTVVCAKDLVEWCCHLNVTGGSKNSWFVPTSDDSKFESSDKLESRRQMDRELKYRQVGVFTRQKAASLRYYFPPERYDFLVKKLQTNTSRLPSH